MKPPLAVARHPAGLEECVIMYEFHYCEAMEEKSTLRQLGWTFSDATELELHDWIVIMSANREYYTACVHLDVMRELIHATYGAGSCMIVDGPEFCMLAVPDQEDILRLAEELCAKLDNEDMLDEQVFIREAKFHVQDYWDDLTLLNRLSDLKQIEGVGPAHALDAEVPDAAVIGLLETMDSR